MQIDALRVWYLRRIVTPVLRAMGIRATTAIATRLARGICSLSTLDHQRAAQRIRATLGDRVNGDTVELLVVRMYENYARFWAEALFIERRFRGERWRQCVSVRDEGALRALVSGDRGCILSTAYFGNVAVLACALGRIYRPVHVLVDYLAHPSLAMWQRELYRQELVVPIDRREAMRRVPDVFRRGGAVLVIAEHERQGGRGIATPFLGRELNCSTTLDRLSRWFGVPVGAVSCVRGERPFSFELALHDVARPWAGMDESNDGVVVRRVLAALERAVLHSPEQYLWSVPTQADSSLSFVSRSLQYERVGVGDPSGSGSRTAFSPQAMTEPHAVHTT